MPPNVAAAATPTVVRRRAIDNASALTARCSVMSLHMPLGPGPRPPDHCAERSPRGDVTFRRSECRSAGDAVNPEQSLRISVALAREVARSPRSTLCSACADVLDVSGVGITIMGGTQAGMGGTQAGQVCVSNSRISALEDHQFTVGEGPCQDAFRSGRPVHAAHLQLASARWPSFVDLASASGVGAVFAFPLISHGAKIGVLTLYQEHEGDLSAMQNDDSLAMVEVLTETVLSLQDDAPSGRLADGLDGVVAQRAETYQASGMVAVQLQIPAAEALVRIRAHAFAHDRPVAAVAADIVARRLRLADDRDVGEEEEG